MTDVQSILRIFLTIPGIVSLISLAYFLSVYFIEDDMEASDTNILKNTAIVAACSLIVLYGRKYLLNSYGKSITSVPTSTVQPNEAFELVTATDKTLGIPNF